MTAGTMYSPCNSRRCTVPLETKVKMEDVEDWDIEEILVVDQSQRSRHAQQQGERRDRQIYRLEEAERWKNQITGHKQFVPLSLILSYY